jgi:hypothetical protein
MQPVRAAGQAVARGEQSFGGPVRRDDPMGGVEKDHRAGSAFQRGIERAALRLDAAQAAVQPDRPLQVGQQGVEQPHVLVLERAEPPRPHRARHDLKGALSNRLSPAEVEQVQLAQKIPMELALLELAVGDQAMTRPCLPERLVVRRRPPGADTPEMDFVVADQVGRRAEDIHHLGALAIRVDGDDMGAARPCRVPERLQIRSPAGAVRGRVVDPADQRANRSLVGPGHELAPLLEEQRLERMRW